MVEVADPTDDNNYIAERHFAANQNHSSEPDYYGSLEEK
jgi:hypothetical protein